MKQLPHTSIIVELPRGTIAKASTDPSGRRMVYCEATRDGTVDRQGEMVAAEGLWKSRDLMLSQGDLDIAHWSHLNNPNTGRPQPEYRIGHPTQVTRQGKSIFTAGEIYQVQDGITPPTRGTDPFWPDYFWHSIALQNPPAKWYPSVYGKIRPGGIEVITVKGQLVRRIVDVEWFSIGFALRAQHPDLGPVSLAPVGNLMAKADAGSLSERLASDTLHLPWQAFAKSVSEVGQPITDHAALEGVQALTRTSLEGSTRKAVPKAAHSVASLRVAALNAIKAGHVDPTVIALRTFFRSQGAGEGEAGDLARGLYRDIQDRSK